MMSGMTPGGPLTDAHWPLDDSVPLVDVTVGGLLAERARTHAGVTAVIGNRHGTGAQVRLTYQELHVEAQRVATALTRLTDPGDFVALWAPNVVEWPIIQYGAALAGVVLVALNPVLRAGELTYGLTHSMARVLIHADRSRDYDMASVAAQVAPHCPELKNVISLSDTTDWRAEHVDATALQRIQQDPDGAVMLQYTSGTTGNPKGVLLRNRSLVNVAKITLETIGAEPGAVAVNPLPMFHTAGCVISTLGPLWIGGTVALVEQFDPDVVLGLLRRERATVLFFVPAVLGALLAAQHASVEPAPRLTTCTGGAATVPAAMIEDTEQTFGASVSTLYGQTELAPVVTAIRPGDSRARQLGSVGRPLPQVECRIIDPTSGRTQPIGVDGEICARGYQAMMGYLHDSEATARAVDPDGWVHTGDLGRMDADGFVSVTGRLKDLIIRGGENISPTEIELCLAQHPAVAQASVVGLPDDQWGEIVAAAVILVGEPSPTVQEELIAHCRTMLSPNKIPARWQRVQSLPVTPTGKVQRFRLVQVLTDPDQGAPL